MKSHASLFVFLLGFLPTASRAWPNFTAPVGGANCRQTTNEPNHGNLDNCGFNCRCDAQIAGQVHTGVDFEGTIGETVVAPFEGTVRFAGYLQGYGGAVILQSNDKSLTAVVGHLMCDAGCLALGKNCTTPHENNDGCDGLFVKENDHVAIGCPVNAQGPCRIGVVGPRHKSQNGGWKPHVHITLRYGDFPTPLGSFKGYSPADGLCYWANPIGAFRGVCKVHYGCQTSEKCNNADDPGQGFLNWDTLKDEGIGVQECTDTNGWAPACGSDAIEMRLRDTGPNGCLGTFSNGGTQPAANAIRSRWDAILPNDPFKGAPCDNGGAATTHDIWGVQLQDFCAAPKCAKDTSSWALAYGPMSKRAFLLKEGFWGAYKCLRDGSPLHSTGGASLLGAPKSDEYTSNGFVFQDFELKNGKMWWDPKDPHTIHVHSDDPRFKNNQDAMKLTDQCLGGVQLEVQPNPPGPMQCIIDGICSTPKETCVNCPKDCCLDSPVLLGPPVGSTFTEGANIHFAWGAVPNAKRYRVTICKDKALANCPYTKEINPPGTIIWDTTTLPAGTWWWTGSAIGMDEAAGWSPYFNPPRDFTVKATPVTPCKGLADGTYCGPRLFNYNGNFNDLVTCGGGAVAKVVTCMPDCVLGGGTGQDYCKPQGPCTGKGNGTYCGITLNGYGGGPDDLVTCVNGAVAGASACATGCQQNGNGTDACVSCIDGIKNGTETDTDCGGGCPVCADGRGCKGSGDCISHVCKNGVCQTPTCNDGSQNGSETAPDCGGVCARCGDFQACKVSGDCQSFVCQGGLCRAPTCTDSVLNGNEADTDCGGMNCPKCAAGRRCFVGLDCQSKLCANSLCQAAPSCSDKITNQDETDTDCGGAICTRCVIGQGCFKASDCLTSYCANGLCMVAPSCTDKIKNQDETDVDCGGLACARCGVGLHCVVGGDCVSATCSNGACAALPACNDGTKNQDETDVDCGGTKCAKCSVGKTCLQAGDCVANVCVGNVCQAATCMDLVKNGTETDVDCGGICPSKCPDGRLCLVSADCKSGVCGGGMCVVASCQDGLKDGNESDTDCGGTCQACAAGKSCVLAADCLSGYCPLGQCVQIVNLLQNARFDNNWANWLSWLGPGTDANIDIDPNSGTPTPPSMKVINRKQEAIGNHYYVQFGQANINIKGANCYQLSLKARADSGRGLYVEMDDAGPNVYYNVGLWGSANLTNAWQTFSYSFKTFKPASARLMLHFGADVGTAYVDDLLLEEVVGPCTYNVAAACNNGIKDNTETDVDCGGGSCGLCKIGMACKGNADCASGICQAGVCVAAQACNNGVRDGFESDVDCGGGCVSCANGKNCGVHADCSSQFCQGGQCKAPGTPCLAAVVAGQHFCLDTGGTMFIRADQQLWGNKPLTDQDVQNSLWEVKIWFEWNVPLGFAPNVFNYPMPLKFVASGIASIQLPVNLPTGLCPQLSMMNQAHPFRMGGIHRVNTSDIDGTNYAAMSQNAALYQTGLVATDLPDQDGKIANYLTIVATKDANNGNFLPAAAAAKQDMYGAKMFCRP